jgi:hypothetical protein
MPSHKTEIHDSIPLEDRRENEQPILLNIMLFTKSGCYYKREANSLIELAGRRLIASNKGAP